jgi:hypothetical protein
MAPPRVIVDLAKPSVYLGVLGALQSHAFPQLHSLLSFIGQFLPLFLQLAGLSAAKETVHIIATRIESRILVQFFIALVSSQTPGAASKNRTYSQDRRAIEWSSQTP